jgi:hypothetical protein
MSSRTTTFIRSAMLAALVAAGGRAAAAQDIVLDRPVRAGQLTLFPSLSDSSQYFYVVDKARLATDSAGAAKFSFLRYVDNQASPAEGPERSEADGGGIVHAVVSLGVTDDQLREARTELQRVQPGARLMGPVVYKAGRFGLISSFKDPQGNLVKTAVAIGLASVLDLAETAVALHLTKQGAKILWESFSTAAPDVSFSFEMDMTGYRSPKRAKVEAEWEKIYQHQAFGAGLASTYLSAEIKSAFDDIRRTGGIKVTQIGEDAQLDQLVNTAYTKLTDMMFEQVNGTGTPDLASLGGIMGGGGTPSLLDRATAMLQKSREEADRENERIRAENRAAEERERAEVATRTGGTGTGPNPDRPGAGDSASPRIPGTTGDARAPSESDGRSAGRVSHDSATAREAREPSRTPRREEVARPAFAAVAAFEMKKVRQSGKFEIDLNKYTSDQITLRFDENIGDLSRLRNDEKHFRQVNLDDPLYRQREVVAMVDGLNAEDFGKFVNFVSVTLRKKHPNGQMTLAEARVDRKNFNREGAAFKLLYGWNGETNATREQWFDYEYQTTWSLFGGRDTTVVWQPSRSGAINLAPPYRRTVVTVDADSAQLATAGVRMVTVKAFYKLGGTEKMEQTTLNARKGPISGRLEFMLPQNVYEYDYEITWQLSGNESRSTGRRKTTSTVLIADELPAS